MTRALAPRSGITGAQITPRRGRVVSRVDWVSFSVPGTLDQARTLLQRVGVYDVLDSGHGGSFFKHELYGPNAVRVRHGRERDECVQVELPGAHLATLEPATIRSLFRHVKQRGGHLSRLDLALDDLDRVTNIPEVALELRVGNAATHAKAVQLVGNMRVGEAATTGAGLYLGSKASDSYLNVYDKYLELAAKDRKRRERGGAVQVEQAAPVDAGVRWELRLRDERATKAAFMLADVSPRSWGGCMAGILAAFVDFRKRGEEKENISRAPRLAWWALFIDGALCARLRVAKPAKTLGRVVSWLDNAVSANLATAYAYWTRHLGIEGADERLWELIAHGGGRMKAEHYAVLIPTPRA